MKYLVQIAILVCACLTLPSTSQAKAAVRNQKLSQSKTKKAKKAKASEELSLGDDELDSIGLDLENSGKENASIEQTEFEDDFANESASAEAQERAGKPDKGAEILMPVSEKLNRRGLVILARLYGKSANPTAQLRTLELALSKNPKDYVVKTLIGDALSQTTKVDEAVAAYNEARKMNKKYKPAYEGLLALFEKKQEFYEARTLVEDMIKNLGNVPRYHSTLCRLYTVGDFLAKATEVCRTATKKDPRNVDNYVNLALSLRDQENAKEAGKILQKAVQRFPASEALHSAAGDLKIANKDYGSAYSLFKKATEVDAKSARAWLGLAQASFELQKNEESLSAFVKACTIDGKSVREFRSALGKLRNRNQSDWTFRFDSALSKHCE